VGGYAQAPLAERWNGSRWSVQSVPAPPGSAGGLFSAVACTGAAGCAAVGGYTAASGPRNLAERWNGTRWAIQYVPTPPGSQAGLIPVGLLGLSCPAAAACTATGSYDTGSRYLAQALTWNGSHWVRQAMPPGTGSRVLGAVSCVASTACTAVGFAFQGSVFGPHTTLAEYHS
jgi:hypothetical protein